MGNAFASVYEPLRQDGRRLEHWPEIALAEITRVKARRSERIQGSPLGRDRAIFREFRLKERMQRLGVPDQFHLVEPFADSRIEVDQIVPGVLHGRRMGGE